MGLFGGGNSKSSNVSNTYTTNQVDNSIYQTDQGAIAGAFNFAGRVSGEAFNLGAESLDLSSNALRETVDFGREALDFADDQTDRAISASERSYETALGFGADIFAQSIEAVGDVIGDGQKQLGSTVTALNSIAREQATSTDQRVQDIAKNALYVGGAVVVVIALVMIFK